MKLFGLLLLILQLSNLGLWIDSAPTGEQRAPAIDNEILEVGVCQLVANAGEYNQKLVKVTGFVDFAFEISVLYLPDCDQKGNGIWVEYGGKTAAGSIYCCGVSAKRSRPEQLVVEDVPVSLRVDKKFSQFDKLLHREPYSTVHASLVGRFFSGKKSPDSSGWEGYGHMGCCSLFAIEQVLSVDTPDPLLDSRSSPVEDDVLEKLSSYRFHDTPAIAEVLTNQKKAETGEASWMLTDDRRVVEEFLRSSLQVQANMMTRFQSKRLGPARNQYILKVQDKTYILVVSRPYWLSFYAADPKRVIWTVQKAIVTTSNVE